MGYFESRIRANFKDIIDIKKKIKFCAELGINNIILEPSNSILKIPQPLKNDILSFSNIGVFFRINIRTEKLNDFKDKLKKSDYLSNIISIESKNKEIQIHAARDSRVDIISFSEPDILSSVSKGVLSLAKQNNSFIEYSLAPLMVNSRTMQSKNFRMLYKNMHLAIKLRSYYLISGNFEEPFDYRNPRALSSICNSLLDIPSEETNKAFKVNPTKLIDRVENRKNRDIIEDGVKMIRGLKDNG